MNRKWLKHKFKAKPQVKDGQHFPSKLEARYYEHLKLLQQANTVLFFLRQVPFHLPGNVTYRLDFMVFYENGDIEFIETKGMDTALSIAKRKMVEDLYPVTIKVVKKV